MSTTAQITERSSFAAIAEWLDRTVEVALPKLQSLSDASAAEPRASGKWSPKQLIGHLIDSASNNHQRFVRAQEGTSYTGLTYAQDHWVTVQGYQDMPWDDIVTLWRVYNSHLSRVIARIPEERRSVTCTIGSNPPVTLGFLVYDYVTHLRHHLRQARALTD